ncbi:MAG: hypothetical protein MUP69_06980 [Candidatus Atribacteria bacterium]|nr:hypothetical protein [Candidatus Atribacteria bacterium]
MAQNEVRANTFSGSLAVFRKHKPTGECWRVMAQNAPILHFPTGGVRSKKLEQISPKICRVGEIPP